MGTVSENVFANLATSGDEETVALLAQAQGVRIERIVSSGHISPPGFWYDQADDEWVCVLRGKGIIHFADGETVTLKTGDHLFIAAHRRHRVDHTDAETIWLAVFIPR